MFLPNLIQTIVFHVGHLKVKLTNCIGVQNAAARCVTLIPKFKHITPMLQGLHWLHVVQQIEYKVLLLTLKALTGPAPQYRLDLLQVSDQSSSHRSNNQNLLLHPHSRTVCYSNRSFAVAAPSLWNMLPQHLRDCDLVTGFKSQLKTYLLHVAHEA